MKKHSSVFFFLVKTKGCSVIGIAILLVLGNLLGFFLDVRSEMLLFGQGMFGVYYECLFLAAYLGCIASCVDIHSRKSVVSYTWQRLQISERSVVFWDMLACVFCFFVLWSIEYASLLGFSCCFGAYYEELGGVQWLSLAYYRSRFLHGVFPMAETGLAVRNLCYLLASGVFCGALTCLSRIKKSIVLRYLALFAIMIIQFAKEPGEEGYFFFAVVMFFMLAAVVEVYQKAHAGN